MLDRDIVIWHKNKFPNDGFIPVYGKTLEELGELLTAVFEKKPSKQNIELEFGDVLICLTVLKDKIGLLETFDELIKMAHEKNLAREKEAFELIRTQRIL